MFFFRDFLGLRLALKQVWIVQSLRTIVWISVDDPIRLSPLTTRPYPLPTPLYLLSTLLTTSKPSWRLRRIFKRYVLKKLSQLETFEKDGISKSQSLLVEKLLVNIYDIIK